MQFRRCMERRGNLTCLKDLVKMCRSFSNETKFPESCSPGVGESSNISDQVLYRVAIALPWFRSTGTNSNSIFFTDSSLDLFSMVTLFSTSFSCEKAISQGRWQNM